MTYNEILTEVAESTGLTKKFIDRVYKSYWKVIREHIEALPLKEDLTDEEFKKFQPNVSVSFIGKLNVTLKRYKAMKKRNKMHPSKNRRKHAKNI